MMQEGGALKPLSLVVGSAELPLLRKQTADFAGHRARYGLPVTYQRKFPMRTTSPSCTR